MSSATSVQQAICSPRDSRRTPHRRCYRASSLSPETVRAVAGLSGLNRRIDRDAERHQRRVAWSAVQLGEYLGLGRGTLDQLFVAGLLHDIGKVAVPQQLLRKTSSLTEEEMSVVRQHAAIGGRIVGALPELSEASLAIWHHHERWDGRLEGPRAAYPDGLLADQIPLSARILSVADSFDAMRSPRGYRRALTRSEALDELQLEKGKHFDPNIVVAFLESHAESRWTSPFLEIRRAAMRRRVLDWPQAFRRGREPIGVAA